MDAASIVKQIADAVRGYFPPLVPAILPEYTDHGPDHSDRTLEYAMKLLEANTGRELSQEERLILEAGAHLHDLGMQCDAARARGITERAESLGAVFNTQFTARSATEYSRDEKAAIRENHSFLSAAMLEELRESREGKLGIALNLMSALAFDELMTVCLYHSGLRISDCPSSHALGIRTQMLASILRLADDLDITTRRADADSESFGLPIESRVHRALHSVTEVRFLGSQVILLRVGLHDEDARLVSEAIQRKYIDTVVQKSGPPLSVLRQCGFPLAFGAESRVETIKGQARLPEDVVEYLLSEEETPAAVDLANEIVGWLEPLGYEAGQIRISLSGRADFDVTIQRGPLSQTVHVCCFEGEIGQPQVKGVRDTSANPTWCVTDTRVTSGARAALEQRTDTRLFTLSEFLRMIWRPYIDSLEAELDREEIEQRYVDLSCRRDTSDGIEPLSGTDEGESLDAYARSWIQERGREQICLLGEFGAGKTWFCKHLAQVQLERFLESPSSERLPLLVSLRDFAKSTSAEQLVSHALVERRGLPFVGSAFRVVSALARRGKLLLILDGFDEMARKVDKQSMVENFDELTRLITPRGKVLLTCRTEYFQSLEEARELLERSSREAALNALTQTRRRKGDGNGPDDELQPHVGSVSSGELKGARTARFETFSLLPMTDGQIREVIGRLKGKRRGKKAADRILATRGIAEMARKPVMVELLLASLDETDAESLETQADVYLHATQRLLLRNIRASRTFTSTRAKLRFLCDLAWQMVRSGLFRVHFTEFPAHLRESFGDNMKDSELDYWKRDLQAQTMLHRDAIGNYQFMHRSVAEYFAALKLGLEARIVSGRYVETYVEASGESSPSPYEATVIGDLRDTLGSIPFSASNMVPVRGFLEQMVGTATPMQTGGPRETPGDRLQRYINASRIQPLGYVGGNALTLLLASHYRPGKLTLDSVPLAGSVLCGRDLTGYVFTNCGFESADLRGALFDATSLKGAKCSGTHLRIFFTGHVHEVPRDRVIPDEARELVRDYLNVCEATLVGSRELQIVVSSMTMHLKTDGAYQGFWDVVADGSVDDWVDFRNYFHGRHTVRLALLASEIKRAAQSHPDLESLLVAGLDSI